MQALSVAKGIKDRGECKRESNVGALESSEREKDSDFEDIWRGRATTVGARVVAMGVHS